ncbi:MAG: hypothetical protein ABWY02_04830 [Telluria sp.]
MRAATMLASKYFLTALLFSAATAQAGTPLVYKVYVEVCVAEQNVDRVMEAVDTPATKRLMGLPGVDELNAMMSHGWVGIEIGFKGGATEDDRATVEGALKAIEFDPAVGLQSVSVVLEEARADGKLPRMRGCGVPAR